MSAADKNILIIEDGSPSTRIARILMRNGCSIRIITDIESAREAIAESEPDLVIALINDAADNGRHLQMHHALSGLGRPFFSVQMSRGTKADDALKNDDAIRAELALYEELARAIDRREFLLHYQPIISLPSRRIAGFEALIRWNHPQKKLVYPDQFIPVVEKSDLIIPIGFWVIEEACRQLRAWQNAYPQTDPLTMSVNLSARQFLYPGIVPDIKRIVAEHGVPPETLRLELTESAIMENLESSNILLLQLKASNFFIYMDDFGTGYSSLSYLKHFPVDCLKIDRSFVRWMEIDADSLEIVRAIITLAHNLRMTVVAEGIEKIEHVDKLIELGCDYGQGYYFSKPVDAASAENLLKNGIV